MEVWAAAVVALYIFTVAWKLREVWHMGVRCDGANAFAVTALALALVLGGGASLQLTVCPDFYGGALLGCSLALMFGMERREKLLLPSGRAVLVTGCDSGFGRALAVALSQRGLTVFAGVLDENGTGARQLTERGGDKLKVLQLDVTNSSQIEAAHRHIHTWVGDAGLWGLVNNAGVLQFPADSELQPLAASRRSMDVNFLAAVHLCQVFLPMLRKARGRIVNVSSMAGEVPMPGLGVYGASKAALGLFSGVLRLELAAWGVKVALIQPAGFRTNIFGSSESAARLRDELVATVTPEAREDYGEAYISSLPGRLARMSQQSAEDLSPVVDDFCHALLSTRPRPLYTPGQMGWLLPFLHRCCPTAAFDAIAGRLFKHTDCRSQELRNSAHI
uniref:Hydroxysteroid (17-beta) dehydrogenase 2 n=1 Tax=Amphilophus citrinellus TaxID=61819 RepID=A0A3Q0SJ58_AMPCI